MSRRQVERKRLSIGFDTIHLQPSSRTFYTCEHGHKFATRPMVESSQALEQVGGGVEETIKFLTTKRRQIRYACMLA